MSYSDLYTIREAGSSVPTMESFVNGEATKSYILSEYSTMDLGHGLGAEKIGKRTVFPEAIDVPLIDLGIIDKEFRQYQDFLCHRYEGAVPRNLSISEAQIEWHTFLDTNQRTVCKGIDEGASLFPKSSRELMEKYHRPGLWKSIIESMKQSFSKYLRFMSKQG